MKWRDFVYDGQIYKMDHLDPFTMQCKRPAKAERPFAVFTVDVTFSFHCFTESLPTRPFDPKLKYADARETRIFNFERYALSKLLPGIVRSLATRQCLHAGRGNFVTVEVATRHGISQKYHVFFEPSRSSSRGRLNLYIQSAYVPRRDVARGKMPMNFFYILHNTMHGLPFKS